MVNKTLRNSADAYVSSKEPGKNFHNRRKLYVKSKAPDIRWAYLYFSVPFTPRSRIMKAEFGMYNGTVLEGGATVGVGRITEDWDEDKIRWNKRPATAAGTSLTKNNTVPENTLWKFDITAMMQSVSNGAPFFGLRFTANDGFGEWFHSSTAQPARYRPYIEISWAEPTDAPTNLSPSGGRAVAVPKPVLTFDWEDMDGETDLSAIFVEFSDSEDFTSVYWNSGWWPTAIPELDLAEISTFPALANNQEVWWRVSARGADGSESEPSDPVNFRRVDQQTVTILNPTAEGVVTENTPPIIWDSSGEQVHSQVILFDPDNGNDILWEGGKNPGPEQDIYLEKKLQTNRNYGIRVNVWDGVAREKNGAIPPYVSAERIFRVEFSDTVAPVTGLTASRVTPWHWTRLRWTRSTAPDHFEIYMDDILVEKVGADDVITGAGSYEYICRKAQPRQDTEFRVVAIVNGKGSKQNPTKTTNYKADSVVLSELDGTNAVMFLNHDYDNADASQYSLHRVLGNVPPVLIMQGDAPEEGSFTGFLYGEAVPGMSAEEERQRFNRLRKNPGRTLLLTRINTTFECYIVAGPPKALADGSGVYYECTFDFYQTDLDA